MYYLSSYIYIIVPTRADPKSKHSILKTLQIARILSPSHAGVFSSNLENSNFFLKILISLLADEAISSFRVAESREYLQLWA